MRPYQTKQTGECKLFFVSLVLGIGGYPSNLGDSIFWINLPICIPALLGVYFFIDLRLTHSSVKSKLKRVDWVGIFVSTGSLVGILYGVTSGNILHPWNSAQVLSALIIGGVGTGIFLLYEAKLFSNPMIPIQIFANRTSNGAYLSSFIMGLVLWAMQYYLIFYVSLTLLHH